MASDGDMRPWEWPECPDCGHNLFVGHAYNQEHAKYLCHRCKMRFDAEA